MPELTQEMKDAYWNEWQQTQDHWLAIRAAFGTLKPIAWMSEFRASVNSNWSTDFSPVPVKENTYFRNIRPVYDLGVTEPLPKVHDHLIATIEAEIKNVQPVPTIGDDDSIYLTERQDGFKEGLEWALRLLKDNNRVRS